MPRPLPAPVAAAAEASVVRPVFLAELRFQAETVRIATSWFDVSAFGHVFSGKGNLANISEVEETTRGQVNRIVMTLSGVNPANISLALNEVYRGRRATVWKCYYDDQDRRIDDPVLWFRGHMDSMPIKTDFAEASVSVIAVSRMVRWEKPHNAPRWDDAAHQQRRPGDLYHQFVPRLVQGAEVTWGRTSPG